MAAVRILGRLWLIPVAQLAAWIRWCAAHGTAVSAATPDDVKRYRENLVR